MCKSKYLIDRGDRLILPDDVVPIRYGVHIWPNLKEFVFRGQVEIETEVRVSTNKLILHCCEVEIQDIRVQGWKETKYTLEYDKHDEIVIIQLEERLEVSEGSQTLTVTLDYTGVISEKLKGVYRSRYSVNGEDRYIATTQFEPNDARRAFPCFDEPALKATFDITLTIDSHLTALSNMPEKSVVVNGDGTTTIAFETTPRMSTYLAAFVVGEFDHIEGHTKGGVRVRVYQCIGKEHENGKFALQVACNVLDYFTDYFNIPFPLKKCDQIAIPDFAFVAMENWGLVTYCENMLLSSSKTSTKSKQAIASIIGHELAHQWFGNLVTMEWWSQLYLNEGFATYMGDKVTDVLFPDWNQWLEFSYQYRQGALNIDALDNSHAIEVKVHHSSQVQEIFDAISYDKGACVIQMVASRFGEAFRQGLHHYLTKHQYQNTDTDDLWTAISQHSNSNVKEFVETFIKHSGYPLIKFIKQQQQNNENNNNIYKLTQQKFGFNMNDKVSLSSTSKLIWKCHIKIKTTKQIREIMLDEKEMVMELDKDEEIIKANYGETGYYRVLYDHAIINRLIDQGLNQTLEAPDRLGILSDVFALSKACFLQIRFVLDVVKAYGQEKEWAIWSLILDNLTTLLSFADGAPHHTKLQEFTIQLLVPVYQRLGFDSVDGESTNDILLRERVNTFLGELAYQPIVEECHTRFNQYQTNSQLHPLSSDVLKVVISTVVANGDMDTLDQVISLYKQTDLVSEKEFYVSVFGLSPSEDAIRKVLNMTIDSSVIRSHDVYPTWAGIPNRYRPVAWQFFKQHFDEINIVHCENTMFANLIASAIPLLATQQEINEYTTFLTVDHSIPVAHRAILQSLESLNYNNNWNQFILSDFNQN